MVKNCISLPEDYKVLEHIDLQKNKKLALIVNGIGLAIMAVMIAAAAPFAPIGLLFDMSNGLLPYMARFGTLVIGLVLYIILHELVHGIFMKGYSGRKPRYGFTGLYAYAGSDAYFNKKSYIIIALAPVVIWGIVLAVINFFVPARWFWVVYIIQICNLSGAGGDIFVTARFAKLPKDILVGDTGVAMTVYSKQINT